MYCDVMNSEINFLIKLITFYMLINEIDFYALLLLRATQTPPKQKLLHQFIYIYI